MHSILVVDGDTQQRGSLAAALAEEYSVRSAGSAQEAVCFLRTETVDVILLEMVLGDGDGFAILARIAGMCPQPHVVVLTGLSQVRTAVNAMKLGAEDYLLKPCKFSSIHAAIHRVLNREPVCDTSV